MKKLIKKIPGFKIANNLRKKIFMKNEFIRDYRFFLSNYMYSKNITIEKIEYEMILEIHKIEKGMACINPRPFGIEKVSRLMKLIEEYDKIMKQKSFVYNMANTCLLEYKKFYETKKWTDRSEYLMIDDFMKDRNNFDFVEVGAFDLYKKDIEKQFNIDYDSFLSSRRSVRNFASRKLEKSDVERAIMMAMKTPSACNRQMCKIYHIKSDNGKKIVEKYALGLGLFDLSNANYFIVTFDVSANYFVGERNQGWFNAGLLSMNFANALHSLGIGSCFIQFGNTFKEEKELKKLLSIPNSERIAVIITAGYYDQVSRIPYSTRKDIEDIYFQR